MKYGCSMLLAAASQTKPRLYPPLAPEAQRLTKLFSPRDSEDSRRTTDDDTTVAGSSSMPVDVISNAGLSELPPSQPRTPTKVAPAVPAPAAEPAAVPVTVPARVENKDEAAPNVASGSPPEMAEQQWATVVDSEAALDACQERVGEPLTAENMSKFQKMLQEQARYEAKLDAPSCMSPAVQQKYEKMKGCAEKGGFPTKGVMGNLFRKKDPEHRGCPEVRDARQRGRRSVPHEVAGERDEGFGGEADTPDEVVPH